MEVEGAAEAAYCSVSMPRPPSSPSDAPTGAPSSLDAADLRALVRGEHGDPFSVLGPHPAAAGTVVRAFVPRAAGVRLRVGRRAVACAPVDPAGLFEATLAEAAPLDPATGRLRYKLEITHEDGQVETRDDPYRYGPVLGEDEL
jgi:1,4-alpha-glucan branching enzyme